MKWDCRVIKFSFTWRKYTMSIKFHCVFPWLTRNNWSEMISFKRWLWVSLVIANSEERGKWKSSFSAAGAAMTWRQRLVLKRTEIRYNWVVLIYHYLVYDTQCLALRWNCPVEIRMSVFGHWQNKCSCHLMKVSFDFFILNILPGTLLSYWSRVLRWWQCSSFPALQRITTPRPSPG